MAYIYINTSTVEKRRRIIKKKEKACGCNIIIHLLLNIQDIRILTSNLGYIHIPTSVFHPKVPMRAYLALPPPLELCQERQNGGWVDDAIIIVQTGQDTV